MFYLLYSKEEKRARADLFILSLLQGWTTANVLRTQLELENQIAKGLKFDLATTLNPAKASKSAILTAIYKQPSLHTRATVDLFKVSVPTLFKASTVILTHLLGTHLHCRHRCRP